MMIVTFCGHGTVADKNDVQEWLYSTTKSLILEGAKIFYLGGYGEFDNLAKAVLIEQKKYHSHIEIVLILPYLNTSIDGTGYCYTLYPPLEGIPKRFAILKRNEWIVKQSEIVIAYVTHGWGGAAKTLEFAHRKKKRVVLYSPNKEVRKTKED